MQMKEPFRVEGKEHTSSRLCVCQGGALNESEMIRITYKSVHYSRVLHK